MNTLLLYSVLAMYRLRTLLSLNILAHILQDEPNTGDIETDHRI